MIPVLLLVSIAIFLIIHLIPGDPAQIIAGPNATDEQLAALNRQFGLDQPLWRQYLIWLGNVLSGNLGNSFLNNYPVNQLVGQAVPATLELAVAALIIGILIAFPLGIIAALRPGSLFDLLSTTFSALSFAVPTFWLAMLFILIFSLQFRWLPPSGRPNFGEQPLLYLKSLLMPALTLGMVLAANLTRYLRSAMLDALQQDYTRTARGKGLYEQAVVVRHVLRNALIPVITVLGAASRRFTQRRNHCRICLRLARCGPADHPGDWLARLRPAASQRPVHRAGLLAGKLAHRPDLQPG